GSSASRGVAPLTWATHGPGRIAPATSAIARSGTHRRTSSPPSARTGTPRSRRRAARVWPARPAPTTVIDRTKLAPVPNVDTGQHANRILCPRPRRRRTDGDRHVDEVARRLEGELRPGDGDPRPRFRAASRRALPRLRPRRRGAPHP